MEKIKYKLNNVQINDKIKFTNQNLYFPITNECINVKNVQGKIIGFDTYQNLLYIKLDKKFTALNEWKNVLHIDLNFYSDIEIIEQ
tara:strand:+ start:70 stop:327 length:258 start_codon:yes stop_codon:yes gene_type:complete